MRCILGTVPFGSDHCGVFLGGGWWIWVAESIREVFGGFEGEACGFPTSVGVIQIVWVVFFGGELAQVAAEACDPW